MESTRTQPGGAGMTKFKMAMIAAGVAAVVGAAGAATHWVHVQELDAVNAATPPQAEAPVRVAMVGPAAQVTGAPYSPDAVHTDVYFDLKSARLRADAVRVLQDHAAQMDRESAWTVLVHGYTDRQGSPEYNKHLAQRRAVAVKRFMVELGIPEASVRTVTVGPDGALCEEPTPDCQQLNRRVHIEMRRLAHAVRPIPAMATPAEVFETRSTGTASPAGQ